MKELSNTILAVVFVCCNGLTNATIITIEPIATGYAVDYDYDGTFDRFYGTPRDDDVRVGRLSWGEARGHVEFRITGIPSTIREYESGNTNDKVFKTLYLDKIYLRRTGTADQIQNQKHPSMDMWETEDLMVMKNTRLITL